MELRNVLARTGALVFAMTATIASFSSATPTIEPSPVIAAASPAIATAVLAQLLDVPVIETFAAWEAPDPDVLSAAGEFVAVVVRAEPLSRSGLEHWVVASWYGPGFYGNRTACGQTLGPGTVGVAHKTLPCGTLVTLSHGERMVTVAVIDRGPYIDGRTFDLTLPVREALACRDLCTVRLH